MVSPLSLDNLFFLETLASIRSFSLSVLAFVGFLGENCSFSLVTELKFSVGFHEFSLLLYSNYLTRYLVFCLFFQLSRILSTSYSSLLPLKYYFVLISVSLSISSSSET